MTARITARSSTDERQRLLKLYQRHHRLPPSSTAELVKWVESEQGREALRAEERLSQRRMSDDQTGRRYRSSD
jgi:hypothetical protein